MKKEGSLEHYSRKPRATILRKIGRVIFGLIFLHKRMESSNKVRGSRNIYTFKRYECFCDRGRGGEEEKPFKYKGKGCNDNGSDNMTVRSKDEITHAMLHRNHGDYVHPCKSKLQGDHCQVWFHFVQRIRQSCTRRLVSHVSLYLSLSFLSSIALRLPTSEWEMTFL